MTYYSFLVQKESHPLPSKGVNNLFPLALSSPRTGLGYDVGVDIQISLVPSNPCPMVNLPLAIMVVFEFRRGPRGYITQFSDKYILLGTSKQNKH